MILLTETSTIKGFYQAKNITGIPQQFAGYLDNRYDTFVFLTGACFPLTSRRAEELAKMVFTCHAYSVSQSKCNQIHQYLCQWGVATEVIKYALNKAAKGYIGGFNISDDEKYVVEEFFMRSSYITKVIRQIELTVGKLMTRIDWERLKDPEYNAMNELLDPKDFVDIGSLLWCYRCFWSIIEGSCMKDMFSSLRDDQLMVFRSGTTILAYSNKGWQELEFFHANIRDTSLTKSYPQRHIMLDEMTFFRIDEGVLVIHDDIVPVVKYRDDEGNRFSADELKVGQPYFVDVTYPYSGSIVEGLSVTFKPVTGCVFKDKVVPMDSATTQFIPNSNIFRFKVANKEKVLPFSFYGNSEQISSESLPWLSK
jgi:hypothetical protein